MKIGYFIIPSNTEFILNSELHIKYVMKLLGQNSGNLLFSNAILTFLDKTNIIENVELNKEQNYYDVIIFPFANLINPKVADSYIIYLTKIINKFTCPFLTFGLGTQIYYDDYIKNPQLLSDILKNFLKILSLKCNNIFIRCENTKMILNSLNIYNITVTGCPSILTNTNSKLGDIIENKIKYFKNNISEIKAIVSHQNISTSKKILNIAGNLDLPIILQENSDDLLIKIFLKKNIDSLNMKNLKIENFHFFYRLKDWLAFIDKFNIFFGYRIHGTIINMINENIGITICHDSRTKGLCESMHIPHIMVEDFITMNENTIYNYLLDNISFDKNIFNDKRIYFAKTYLNEFEKYNIPLSNVLKNIINQSINEKTIHISTFPNDIELPIKLPDDFDVSNYKKYNSDLNNISDIEAILHYIRHGKYENRVYKYKNIPEDFNVSNYKKYNVDLKNYSDIDAKNHYELYGYKENRIYKYKNIPEDFNVLKYKKLNIDLKDYSDIDAKNHYELYGYKENRKYKYENIPEDFNVLKYKKLNSDIDSKNYYELYKKRSKNYYELSIKYKNIPPDFDVSNYKKLNIDLKDYSDIDAKNHYELFGYQENRKYKYENIPQDFDVSNYKKLNIDLKDYSDIDAKNHYELYGCKEHRIYKYKNIPQDFDVSNYKKLNIDLKDYSDIDAKNHYELCGYKENRKYKYENIPQDFDAKVYKKLNINLIDYSDINAKNHYELFGYQENRKYKYENIPQDFDSKVYKKLPSDDEENNNFNYEQEQQLFLKHWNNLNNKYIEKDNNTICLFHCGNINIFNEIISSFSCILKMKLIITYYNDEYTNILQNMKELNIIKLIQVINKGADIGPFLLSIKFLLENSYLYDNETNFLKIHTKSTKDWCYDLIENIVNFKNKTFTIPVIFGSNKYIYNNEKGVNYNRIIDIIKRNTKFDIEDINNFFDLYYNEYCSDTNNINKFLDLYPSLEFYKNYEPDLNGITNLEHWHTYGIYEFHRKSNVNYIKSYAKYKNKFVAGTIFGFNKLWLDLFKKFNIEFEYSILEEYIKNSIETKIHAWEYFFGLITYLYKGLIIGNVKNKIEMYPYSFNKKYIKYSVINQPYNKSKIAIFLILPNDNPDSGGYRSLLNYINILNEAGYVVDIYFGVAWNDIEVFDNVNNINDYGMPICSNWLDSKDINIIYKLINNIKKFNEININSNNYYLGLKCQKKYDILIANAWQIAEAVYLNKIHANHLYYIIQDREELFYNDETLKKAVLKTYHNEFNYYCVTNYLSNYFKTIYNFKNVFGSYLGINTDIYYNKNIKRENSVVIPYYGSVKPTRLPNLVSNIIKKLSENNIKCYVFPFNYPYKNKNVINLGTLSVTELNNLYNNCKVGIIFSNSNPSRLGFEMYGSGLNVIEYDSDFTKYDIPDKYFTKIKDEQNILYIVNNLFNKKHDNGFLKEITNLNDKTNFLDYIKKGL